jgi:4-phytase / acid phosphatase
LNPLTPHIKPEPSAQRRKAAVSLKTALASLLIALAIEAPVLAQTIRAADDGTVLKQIIIFGRHGIRAPTSPPAGTNGLNQFSANPYPDFVDDGSGVVTPGNLTLRGKLAAGLLGSYFGQYLRHEGLLTGNTSSNVYFRANSIERSYMTAAKFGAGLLPGATIPIHTYQPPCPDPAFDPLLAGVGATPVDPVRALTEIQGVFGNGASLASAYSGEFSLISNALYPPGTQPTNSFPQQGSVDPTTLPIAFAVGAPIISTQLCWIGTNAAGGVIDMGGFNATVTAADPFVMQYADNFPTNQVAWGRLTLDAISQQTRINTLQIDISMRQPYLGRVQSSSAASHVLRSMIQATSGVSLAGAFGDAQSQVLVVVSSDYYVAGLAGLLDAHWWLPGYQPDFCAPGGALVFELRQVTATQDYLVRVFYTAQTFDQLRNLTTLSLTNPPATMQLLIPGGGNLATNLDVSFTTFTNLLNQAIGLEYVQQPFDQEIPPGVLDDPYTAYNQTNLTVSVSGKTLTIAWPADHLDWILQAQTNGLSAGQWFNLPGTELVTSVHIPIDPANPSVYYRLSRP